MKKLFSIFIFLFLDANVFALNKSDCWCKRTAERPLKDKINFENSHYPWLVTFFDFEEEKMIPEKDIELIPDTVKVNTQLCQAIILNEKTLLSSATCASLLDSNYTAKAGSVDLVKLFESKGFKVKETIIHPNWTYQNGLFINDVALVILDDEIEFKRNRIEPACFDFNNTKEYSDSLFAAGHGNGKRVDSEKSDEENRSRFVKEIYLIEKSNDKNTCFDDSVIYVEATKDEQRYGNITLSENDSGTGLMIFKSDKFYVVGILNISPMAVAEDNEYFFMFTRLSKHWEWIEKHVKNDFCEASY